MSKQPSLWDTPNATSLPEVDSGALPSDRPDGPTIDPSGPEAALASRTLAQPKPGKGGSTIPVIYGPNGAISSASAGLSASLASKLTTVLHGSTECTLTWSRRILPSGRLIFRLVPRTRPSKDCAPTLWPCPTVQDSKNNAGPSQWRRNSFPLNVQVVAHTTARTERPENLESYGALNPEFTFWLMGIPAEWISYGLRATASLSRRRKRSSKRQEKR